MSTSQRRTVLLVTLLLSTCNVLVNGFTVAPNRLSLLSKTARRHEKHPRPFFSRPNVSLHSTSTDSSEAPAKDNDDVQVVGVVAPLHYLGPYPCLALRFPRRLNETVLNFLLDTGANVNSVSKGLVEKLDLPLVMSVKDIPLMGSAGVGGSFQPGDVYEIGDCQLHGLPQNFTFMKNLTAAGLPYPSPVGDGLLGVSFFMSFPAGVEFDWHGTDGDPPTLIFYYGKDMPADLEKNMTRLPLQRLAVQLVALTVNINGVEMPAILDTGSPLTVLNQAAAKQAGIETVPETAKPLPKRKQEYGDEILAVGGVDGNPVFLKRSQEPVSIRTGGGEVSLGQGPIYVGEMPGLAFVGGLAGGESAPPAAVLGLDSLKRTYRMVLRVDANEVWFEELKKQIE